MVGGATERIRFQGSNTGGCAGSCLHVASRQRVYCLDSPLGVCNIF